MPVALHKDHKKITENSEGDYCRVSYDGWAEFRLLIDREGKPAKDLETKGFDCLVLKGSSPEFKQLVPAMIAAMTFERATENPNTTFVKAMNRFKVTVAGQAIQIEQFSGN